MSDRILVIDDSADVHILVKVRLAREQVEITSAYDAASGLAAARAEPPDLILLDVEMPDRDGFAVCEELKNDSDTMHVPVIFLTGVGTSADKIRGLDLGATDYITKPFDPAELRARVRATLRTQALMELLSNKAMIDGLTGLWNRMYLDARLSAELAAARRTGNPLSCIMLDIDRFKAVNDTYGHSFGDEVLRVVARVLTASLREEDVVCRYGGEEFTILLPNTDVTEAAELAERLRIGVQSEPIIFREQKVQVTCSFGVANLRGEVPPSVVELADAALYQAKHSGRNRVTVAPPPTINAAAA